MIARKIAIRIGVNRLPRGGVCISAIIVPKCFQFAQQSKPRSATLCCAISRILFATVAENDPEPWISRKSSPQIY
jgi:hypothetical protein